MRDRIFAEVTAAWREAYEAGLFTEFMEQRAPGHTVLDDKIYSKGMLEFKRDIAGRHRETGFPDRRGGVCKTRGAASFDISCDAVIVFAQRHAELAAGNGGSRGRRLPPRRVAAESRRFALVCRPTPPANFHEALQYYWFCHLAVITELNGWDSFNPGHLDQHLLPFYQRGLAEGTLTRDAARELLECFFIKFNNHPGPAQGGCHRRRKRHLH